jgi:hypothetical protein
VKDAIISAIEQHATNRPRSLQTRPGPSDLAQDCDHCLAAKLAGWPKRSDPAWLAYIGTAVHAQVEQAMPAHWSTELEVTVGTIAGEPVVGHLDLWIPEAGLIVDFKTAGAAKLTAARRGEVPEHYRRQVHLYARGMGGMAKHVALLFLPRNMPNLSHAVWWTEPYSQTLADFTIGRARTIAHELGNGRAVQDFPRAEGCYDCPRYDDAPGIITGTLNDLFT